LATRCGHGLNKMPMGAPAFGRCHRSAVAPTGGGAAPDRRAGAHAGAAASWLQTRPRLGSDVFARPAAKAPPSDGGYVALMQACLVVLRGREGWPEAAPFYRLAVPELWRVPDALARIRALLAELPDGGELARFLPPIAPQEPQRPLKARAAMASTFLAGLELARAGQIRLEQTGAFDTVMLHPRQGEAAAA
jgi:segregation and condensation protein A